MMRSGPNEPPMTTPSSRIELYPAPSQGARALALELNTVVVAVAVSPVNGSGPPF